ncbi:MAG: transposase [Phycisphaerales bacterium]|nr:transposase [Phycisphaerales bacterium]
MNKNQQSQNRYRELKDGAYYHIVNRGVAKSKTFLDEEDYDLFIRLLKRGCEHYDVKLIAYSLMPNHIHLLVLTVNGDRVSDCMQWVTGNYARIFNLRHDRKGHLWQGRFRSKEVVEGRQLGNTWRYVEQNPVRARLVDSPEQWEWTSAHMRNNATKGSFLTEPQWWGSEKMKRWWSNERLSTKEVHQIREALQNSTLLETLVDSC